MSSRRARIVLLRNSKYCYNKALATDCRCFVPDQRIRTLGFNSSSPSSAFFGLVAAAGALAAFAALAACLSRCFCLRLSSLEISRVSNLSSFSLKLNVETHDLEIISPVSGSLCKFCSLGWAASGPDIFDGMTSVKEKKKLPSNFLCYYISRNIFGWLRLTHLRALLSLVLLTHCQIICCRSARHISFVLKYFK